MERQSFIEELAEVFANDPTVLHQAVLSYHFLNRESSCAGNRMAVVAVVVLLADAMPLT